MLRVLTVPVKVSPDLVKMPMVAMVCSSSVLGTAANASSMAIDRPEAIGAAAFRPAAQRKMVTRPTFLLREQLPPRGSACGVSGQGKKAGGTPLRLRRSRHQPAFGQIKPAEGV